MSLEKHQDSGGGSCSVNALARNNEGIPEKSKIVSRKYLNRKINCSCTI